MTRAWSPTGLIPWFSKTEGNTYAALMHHPFLFEGKPTQCSRASKKDFLRRCRGDLRQVKTYQVPITTLILHITLFAICLSFSSPPLHPCHFIRPLFLSPSLSVHLLFFNLPLLPVSCFLVCWIACLSRWLKILLNCVTLLIPTTMISLALRLLLLPKLNLVKLMLLC